MRTTIVVREYARLTSSALSEITLDRAHIPDSAFEWLCGENQRIRRSGAALVHVEDRRWLRLDNYVGVIETPCGTRIEILPKTVDNGDSSNAARSLLRRMLSACLDLPARESAPTDIQAFDAPLTEWVMRQFLQALDAVVKRGLRFDYHRVQEERRFLRGRLDASRQLRQPPGRGHFFQVEHDVFDANRPENRLLCSALDRVCAWTHDPGNWRLSHELASYLAGVPRSSNFKNDFRGWGANRLLAHYKSVRPWCTLILGEQTPLTMLGSWEGPSLLFPMEKIFESYVEVCLRKVLPRDTVLKTQASSRYLCSHNDEEWFQLKPDFLVKRGKTTWVLDAKWKLLDQSTGGPREKYGLNQADFYQMLAYGQRYLPSAGTMLLIYPMTSRFNASLPSFSYSDHLQLRVVPFDLETGSFVDMEEVFGC
ncbi:McrC family protein [Luteibacter sp. Lutesp34]|uniref:McrC family protein n=1 Tax=Luteibacter sp. Lutesp34 TaxID=3243030 RepID=UPI0039B595F1